MYFLRVVGDVVGPLADVLDLFGRVHAGHVKEAIATELLDLCFGKDSLMAHVQVL
jgi:hypothetical protein